jgi:hypothetical protein
MEVHIRIDHLRPPVGQLTVTGQPDPSRPAPSSIPFTGWLDLLRALSDVFELPEQAPPSP